MKKLMNAKRLVALTAAAALAACLAAGCAQTPAQESGEAPQQQEAAQQEGEAAQANGQSAAFDMTAYPEHAAACEGADSLAGFHMALGQDCASCHTGDFAAQLETAGVEGEPELSSLYYTDTATCLGSGCHESWDSLAQKTADLDDYNPHDSIHGTIEDCNECHKGHSEQVDICGQCHPNGGQTMKR